MKSFKSIKRRFVQRWGNMQQSNDINAAELALNSSMQGTRFISYYRIAFAFDEAVLHQMQKL